MQFYARYLLSPIFLISFLTACGQYNNIYIESAWAERDQWQQASRIIRLLGVTEGSVVADIGCHEGYMTVKLAREVGRTGLVYAVDVERYKLDRLKENVKERKLDGQVKAILGDYDDPKLPVGALDGVLIMDTYHEMDDYMTILEHVRRSLKPDGKLMLVEPVAEEREEWSRVAQEGKHELAIRYALEDLKAAGFKIVKKMDPFLDRSEEKGDQMWLIIAEKAHSAN